MKKIIYLIVILSTLISCEEEIIINATGGENQIVIEGYVYDNLDTQTVRITRTIAIYEDYSDNFVDNATVSVFDNTGNITYSFVNYGNGIYKAQFKGIIGRKYTLNVKINSDSYVANDSLMKVQGLDSIRICKSSFNEDNKSIFVYGKDPIGKGNRYKFNSYIKNNYTHDQYIFLGRLIFEEDEYVDGKYIKASIYNDRSENSETVDYEKITEGTSIVVQECSITKDSYDFYNYLNAQISGGGLFNAPPANIKGNVWKIDANGNKSSRVNGLFSAQAVSSDTIKNFKLTDLRIEK